MELVDCLRLGGGCSEPCRVMNAESGCTCVEAADRIAAMEAERADLVEMLREAVRQIEYLHEKFQTTATGETVLARIRMLLAPIEPK